MFKKYFPHIFTLCACLTLLALGTWQIHRREWKQNLITKLDSHVSAPPIILTEYTNIQTDEFKRITLTGQFLNEKEILILNKPFNGKPGQYVFTPFQTTNGDIIEVNRGWVMNDQKITQINGPTTIEGLVTATQKPNWIGNLILLHNAPDKKIWFWIELPKIYRSMGLPVKDFYLDLTAKTIPNVYPYPLPAKPDLYNEHLQYAVTWYSLAIILLVIYYYRFWYHTPPSSAKLGIQGDSVRQFASRGGTNPGYPLREDDNGDRLK